MTSSADYPKLTSADTGAIIDSVREGVPPKVAARARGISAAQYDEIMELGRLGVVEYTDFRDRCLMAEAFFEASTIQAINSNSDWRSKYQLLESRFNERWGKKLKIELKEEYDKFLDAAQEVLQREDYIRLIRYLAGERSEAEVSSDNDSSAGLI